MSCFFKILCLSCPTLKKEFRLQLFAEHDVQMELVTSVKSSITKPFTVE